MTSFAHRHITSWREGQFYDHTGATVIVSWDQKHDAYDVPPEDAEAFEAWAFEVFGHDNTDPEDISIRWLGD